MIREIQISPVLNGYIVKVGCQTVVFDSRDELLTSLSSYLKDPDAIEKFYLMNAVNKMPEACVERAPSSLGDMVNAKQAIPQTQPYSNVDPRIR